MKFFDQLEKLSALKGGGADERAPLGGAHPLPPSSYLESPVITVGSFKRTTFEVRPSRCRCRFCDDCQRYYGRMFRERLKGALRSFVRPFMVTLTIDPAHFAGDGRKAFEHVQERRAIAEMVRTLWDAQESEKSRAWMAAAMGKTPDVATVVMHSRRWCCILEFQKNGMPHWHLILDADFIDVGRIRGAWNRFIPSQVNRRNARVGMGAVKFTVREGFASSDHAANYLTKYVTKPPRHGWPEWVMRSTDRIRRFTSCRGFWPDGVEQDRPELSVESEEREPTTIRQRVLRCRTTCTVFERIEGEIDGNGVFEPLHYVGKIDLPPIEAFKRLGIPAADCKGVDKLVTRNPKLLAGIVSLCWTLSPKFGNNMDLLSECRRVRAVMDDEEISNMLEFFNLPCASLSDSERRLNALDVPERLNATTGSKNERATRQSDFARLSGVHTANGVYSPEFAG